MTTDPWPAEREPSVMRHGQNDVIAIQDQYVYQNFTGLFYNQNWLTRTYSAI